MFAWPPAAGTGSHALQHASARMCAESWTETSFAIGKACLAPARHWAPGLTTNPLMRRAQSGKPMQNSLAVDAHSSPTSTLKRANIGCAVGVPSLHLQQQRRYRFAKPTVSHTINTVTARVGRRTRRPLALGLARLDAERGWRGRGRRRSRPLAACRPPSLGLAAPGVCTCCLLRIPRLHANGLV